MEEVGVAPTEISPLHGAGRQTFNEGHLYENEEK